MARTPKETKKSDEERPKRPVLTVTISRERMESLDSLVKGFQELNRKLPQNPWLKLPTTRGGVASWLIDRGMLDALEKLIAVKFEIDEIAFYGKEENRNSNAVMPTIYDDDLVNRIKIVIRDLEQNPDYHFSAIRSMIKK